MGASTLFALAILMFALATPETTLAASALLQEGTDHCTSEELAVLSETERDALSSDEKRVVLWLVHQILNAEDDDNPLVLTEAAVSRALGLDVCALDRERIRRHVRAALVGISCQRTLELLS